MHRVTGKRLEVVEVAVTKTLPLLARLITSVANGTGRTDLGHHEETAIDTSQFVLQNQWF